MALLIIDSVALLFRHILANFARFRVTFLLGYAVTLLLRNVMTLFLVSVPGLLANLLVDLGAFLTVDSFANLLVAGGTRFTVGSLKVIRLYLVERRIP